MARDRTGEIGPAGTLFCRCRETGAGGGGHGSVGDGRGEDAVLRHFLIHCVAVGEG